MVNALTLNQSLATNDVTVMRTTSHPLRAMVARWVDENQNAIQQKKKKKNRSEIRHKQHSKSYLDPVIIKLDNVIAKYEVKKSILEDLYMGVSMLSLFCFKRFELLSRF